MVTVHAHATTPFDLYESILVDSPLGPYFVNCLTTDDLSENNVEQMKDKLLREYYADFYKFCQEIGGSTSEVLPSPLLHATKPHSGPPLLCVQPPEASH